MSESFLSFPMYESRISLFDALPDSSCDVLFVGDSLTQRNQWQEYFSNSIVLNRGIDSDRTLGVLLRLPHIVALKPKKIFLMIGINDVNDNRGMPHMFKNYEAIFTKIKEALPDTTLYIQSLLPVNNSTYGHGIVNDDVKQVNRELMELAKRYDLPFIDIYSHVEEENELDKVYTVDGCHLSGEGYKAWVNVVRPYVEE